MVQKTLLEWNREGLPIRFGFGEIRLFSVTRDAVRAAPDALRTPPLADPASLAGVLDEYGVDAAYVQSLPLSEMPRKFSSAGKFMTYVAYTHYRLSIDARPGLESYLASLGKKQFKRIRQQERKAATTCKETAPMRVFTEPSEMLEFHRQAMHIAERSFQSAMFGYGLPNTREFIDSMLAMAERKAAFGYILYIDDKPAAYFYSVLEDGGVMHFLQTGHDKGCSKLSPGMVLFLKSIKHSFAHPGVTLIDLDIGDFDFKKYFATERILCADVYFFRKTLANYAIVFGKYGLQKATRLTSFILEKLNLRLKIRNAVRNVVLALKGRRQPAGTKELAESAWEK
jgi:CelD/BcsL family acetyltransferase involved in cellulose biosynthesis